MKPFFLKTLSLALLVVLATGCDSNNDNDVEQLGLYPLTGGALTLYADQTEDSLIVIASRAWTLSTNSTWLGLQGDVTNKTVQGQPTGDFQTTVDAERNTTGHVRTATVRLSDNKRTVGRIYLQAYWLNIQYPEATFNDTPEIGRPETFDGVTFDLDIPRDSTSEYIEFTIYSAQAQLTTDATWISPREVTTQRGHRAVRLTCTPNTTGTDRTAVYTLTSSNGVSTPITVTQRGK